MEYDRKKAVEYAHTWAFRRNPLFADFEGMGGDCANFVSQCLLAGGAKMNTSPVYGWYYFSLRDRSPAWSGVEQFYRFAANNRSDGPKVTAISAAESAPGDIVQLVTAGGRFHHSGIIVSSSDQPALENILIACHSFDADYRPLSSYNIRQLRFLKVLSV